MALRHSKKRLELLPFEEASARSIPLPRDRYIKWLDCFFSASLVITGGSGAGDPAEDGVLKLFRNISVIADGVKALFNVPLKIHYFKNTFEFGTRPHVLDPTDDAAATYPICVFFRIDFQNNAGIKRCDSYLPAPFFKSLDLIVDWANIGVMFDNAVDYTAAAISNAYGLRVVVHQTTEPAPKFTRLQGVIEREITANTREFIIDLPVHDRIYQNFVFRTDIENATADPIRSNAVVSVLDLVTDESFYHINKLPWTQHQHANKLEHSLESLYDGAVLDAMTIDGLMYLDMLEDGRIPSGLNVFDTNTARLIHDVTVGAYATRLLIEHDAMVPIETITS
ncbi:hypothetical protein ES702_04966 [subsurface metagenome]